MTEQIVDIRSAVQKEISNQLKIFMIGQAVIEWDSKRADEWKTKEDVKQFLNSLICRPKETFFEVGDVIRSLLEDDTAIVLEAVPNDNTIWFIDEHGSCDCDEFATENWKTIGHTTTVETLLNMLKEG